MKKITWEAVKANKGKLIKRALIGLGVGAAAVAAVAYAKNKDEVVEMNPDACEDYEPESEASETQEEQ